MSNPNAKKPDTAPASTAVAKLRGWARPIAEVNAVIRKAEAGDADAMAEVNEMLDQPGTADRFNGNVAKQALRAALDNYAGGNKVIRAAAGRKLEEMRAELSGPNPTALEKLLIDRVLATWLHLHKLEAAHASKESMSLALGLYYQRCTTAAHKRYLSAIRGPADVRKLAFPELQVNIANKQVNVAGAPAAPVPLRN